MFTLLEYVIEQLLGPPYRTTGDGQSFWPCPECDSEKFHSMPVNPRYKHRFRCHRCGFRGDVYDLLQYHYPEDRTFDARQVRLRKLERDYKAALAAATAPGDDPAANPPTSFSSRGSSGSTQPPTYLCSKCKETDGCQAADDEFSDEATAALEDLLDFLYAPGLEPLAIARKALEICSAHHLHPLGFASRCDFQLTAELEYEAEYGVRRSSPADHAPQRTRSLTQPRKAKSGPAPGKKPLNASAGRVGVPGATPGTNGKAPKRWKPPRPIDPHRKRD